MRSWGLITALASGHAFAIDVPIAILEVRPSQGIRPEDAEPLETLVAGCVSDAGRSVLGPSEVAKKLAGHPELLSCARGACLEEVAAFLGGPKLLGGSVYQDRENVILTVDLWVWDPIDRASVTTRTRCEHCGPDQAPRLTAQAVLDVLEKDARRHVPATLGVKSDPPQATVRIDGLSIGLTPLSYRVPAGPHGVSVEREGYRTAMRDVYPEAGQAIEISFLLDPTPVQVSPRPPWSPAWKWLAWAGSLIAMGTGTALLLIDGNELSRTGNEIELRETTAEGGLALGLGGALGITGFVVWALEQP